MGGTGLQKVIVVLGAGRSGTSILTRSLGACGMRLSDNMVGASEQNPEGAYEDKEIYEIQSKIFKKLESTQVLPMPNGWMDNDWIEDSIQELRSIVENRLAEGREIWGFKDPRTALLLPLWVRVFNRANVVPLYIMAVREPRAVVTSLNRQYGIGEKGSELFWLYKSCEILYHTGGNVFITHYEDWFDRPEDLLQNIVKFTGLGFQEEYSFQELIGKVVHNNLNRSVYTDYTIQNNLVSSFYDILKVCRYDAFDRNRLMDKMMECRTTMNEFSGWAEEAHKIIRQGYETIKTFKKKNKRNQLKIEEIEHKLEMNRKRNDQWKIEVDNLLKEKERKDHLITDMSRKHKEHMENKVKGLREKHQLEQLRILTSFSYKLGLLLTTTFRQPLKNIILLPYRLFRLFIGKKYFTEKL